MRLTSFSVKGFRSLKDVPNIPISSPTILAGHNDGGKSSVIKSLSFLIGTYPLIDEDRTYSESPTEAINGISHRCTETSVVGKFALSKSEQTQFGLPENTEIRRVSVRDEFDRLEYWAPVPKDERLRDLDNKRVPDLKALAKELGVTPAGSAVKSDYIVALREYAKDHSGPPGWIVAPKDLALRMPKILVFDGEDDPEKTVKSALKSRFQEHVSNEDIKESIQVLEDRVQERLNMDAEEMCSHIRERCPDFKHISVRSNVSFSEGFNGAELQISRASGEKVSLNNAGRGSNRRISLAVWEWVSGLIQSSEAGWRDVEMEPTEEEDPVQHIVVYDEPDTHLDYTHQRQVMKLIREQCSADNVNVVVATHSMNLIDGVDISDVVHLSLKDERTTVERLGAAAAKDHDDIDKHLQEIASSLGIRNSVLLHERYFVAVEGESEIKAIPILFRLSEGLSLQAAGIAIWSGANNDGALRFASYLVNHSRSVMVLVDADCKSSNAKVFKDANLTALFKNDKDRVVKFIGDPGTTEEFEALFSNHQWACVANEEWPRENQWTEAEFQALRSSKKFSTDLLQLLRNGSESGPGGKPEMMQKLALSLREPDDVPEQLRAIFRELREGAE
jgi:putative ATP-dependent endonuclease of the OLD family